MSRPCGIDIDQSMAPEKFSWNLMRPSVACRFKKDSLMS
jgi:hypothetical protein